MKKYYAELKPDARGFSTFLSVSVLDGQIVEAKLDGVNKNNNPYGTYKSESERYNAEMKAESGIMYAEAAYILEKDIIFGKYRKLGAVKGARFLSQDAQILLDDIKEQIEKDMGDI